MTCLQLANQIGLFFSSTTHCKLTFIVPMPQSGCFIIQLPRRVLRVYWLGYLAWSVFRERVSGASSLVCTGLKAFYLAKFGEIAFFYHTAFSLLNRQNFESLKKKNFQPDLLYTNLSGHFLQYYYPCVMLTSREKE